MSTEPASILRTTPSGTTLKLSEHSSVEFCAVCARPDPVGIAATTEAGVHLDTGLCAGCLATALAILFGRRHIQDGGTLGDLKL